MSKSTFTLIFSIALLGNVSPALAKSFYVFPSSARPVLSSDGDVAFARVAVEDDEPCSGPRCPHVTVTPTRWSIYPSGVTTTEIVSFGGFAATNGDGSQLVGFSNNHGYSWTELGGLVNLDPLVPGIDITYVADVSSDGTTIVGQARGSTGVSRELLLARFEEVLAPAIIEVGGNSLATAQFGDALLTAQPFEDDPHLLLGSKLPAGAAANLPHCCFGGLLLLRHIETLLGVLDPMKCLLA
jgi:hypothetical protein